MNKSNKQRELFEAVQTAYRDAKYNHKIMDMEVDIFIPEIRLAVEYDGRFYHQNKVSVDIKKSMKLLALGYRVLRIREEGLVDLGIPGINCLIVSTREQPYKLLVYIMAHYGLSGYEMGNIRQSYAGHKTITAAEREGTGRDNAVRVFGECICSVARQFIQNNEAQVMQDKGILRIHKRKLREHFNARYDVIAGGVPMGGSMNEVVDYLMTIGVTRETQSTAKVCGKTTICITVGIEEFNKYFEKDILQLMEV